MTCMARQVDADRLMKGIVSAESAWADCKKQRPVTMSSIQTLVKVHAGMLRKDYERHEVRDWRCVTRASRTPWRAQAEVEAFLAATEKRPYWRFSTGALSCAFLRAFSCAGARSFQAVLIGACRR